MILRTLVALVMVISICSDALATSKRQPTSGYWHLTDLCRQTGPITMPAAHPVCNRWDWLQSGGWRKRWWAHP
jgi:hypothetical protein